MSIEQTPAPATGISVSEDAGAITTNISQLDFTEPDAVLVTFPSAFVARMAMNKYLLLAGRTGTTNDPVLSNTIDGTLAGSNVSGKDLILQSTTHATKGGVRYAGQTADPATLTPGNTWFRSDQQRLAWLQGNSVANAQVGYQTAVLLNATTDQTLNGGTAGDQLFTNSSISLPANFFTVGKGIRIYWALRSTTNGVVTFQFKYFMGSIGNTVMLDFGAQTVDSVGTVDLTTTGMGLIVCRSTGAAGTCSASGEVIFTTAAAPTNVVRNKYTINTGTFDTTNQQAFGIKIAIAGAGATAADTATLAQVYVESVM